VTNSAFVRGPNSTILADGDYAERTVASTVDRRAAPAPRSSVKWATSRQPRPVAFGIFLGHDPTYIALLEHSPSDGPRSPMWRVRRMVSVRREVVMAICPRCSSPGGPDDVYCQGCGARLRSPVTPPSGGRLTVEGPSGHQGGHSVAPASPRTAPDPARGSATVPERSGGALTPVPPSGPPGASPARVSPPALPSMPHSSRGSGSMTPIYKRWWLWVAAAILVVVGLVHVIQDHIPSNSAELCSAYSNLNQQVNQDNGIFQNGVFSATGTLAGIAGRYPDSEDVKAEAPELHSIANGTTTTVGAIDAASSAIASQCGQSPIGLDLGNS